MKIFGESLLQLIYHQLCKFQRIWWKTRFYFKIKFIKYWNGSMLQRFSCISFFFKPPLDLQHVQDTLSHFKEFVSNFGKYNKNGSNYWVSIFNIDFFPKTNIEKSKAIHFFKHLCETTWKSNPSKFPFRVESIETSGEIIDSSPHYLY